MGEYKVAENENLNSIAYDNKFNNWRPIYEATNKKWPGRITNPHIIAEGMTIIIPEKKAKKVGQLDGTSVKYCASSKSKHILRLRIKDPHGEIKNAKKDIVLKINGSKVEITDETNYKVNPVKYKTISTTEPLPDGLITNSSIEINHTLRNGKQIKNSVTLEVGGLDPFMDPNSARDGKPTDNVQARKAVQKVLKNQGYYLGEIDGDLAKLESVLALISFQLKNGLYSEQFGKPTDATLVTLKNLQGQSIDQERLKFQELTDKVSQKIPLFSDLEMKRYHFAALGQGWKQKPLGRAGDAEVTAKVGKTEKYLKREDDWHGSGSKKTWLDFEKKPLLNLSKLCVATNEQSSKNANVCRSEGAEFIFMDIGRWKNAARDFGLVYGRNVYLCNYNRDGKGLGNSNKGDGFPFAEKRADDKTQYRDGLDLKFFRGFLNSFVKNDGQKKAKGVINIQSFGFVDWLKEKDWDEQKEKGHFDWEHIHIIMPDMHLMSPEIAHIWYRILDKDGEDYIFLKPERDLFDFVTDLTERIDFDVSKLKVVNVGDVYDLWVGMGVTKMEDGMLRGNYDLPLFKENGDEQMILENEPGAYFFDAIKREKHKATVEDKHNYILEGIKNIQKIMDIDLHTHVSNYKDKKKYEDAEKKKNERKAELDIAEEKLKNAKAGDENTNQNAYTGGDDTGKVANADKAQDDVDVAKVNYQNAKSAYEDEKLKKQPYDDYKHKLVNENKELNDWFKENGDDVNKYKGQKRDYENAWKYLNPAEAALRKLETKLGSAMSFIYGNHDSYLADATLTDKAKLGKRKAWLRPEKKALFIEHGQRLEAFFLNDNKKYNIAELETKRELSRDLGLNTVKNVLKNSKPVLQSAYSNKVEPYIKLVGWDTLSIVPYAAAAAALLAPAALEIGVVYLGGKLVAVWNDTDGITQMQFPTNEDGNFSGCIATNILYNAEKRNVDSMGKGYFERDIGYLAAKSADFYAGSHDQRIYRRAFATYWLGEKSNGRIPPSIFVIGHTHMPQLIHVKIVSDDLNDQMKENQDTQQKELSLRNSEG